MIFILFVFIGSILGLFIGAIPGLSVTMAISILASMTYGFNTYYAIAIVMGIYVVGVFSGSISAILLNIPGAPSNIVTAIDGYKLTKKNKANSAIKISALYSFVGSVIGFICLYLFSFPLSKIALLFSPLDYFLISIFGIIGISSLNTDYKKVIISASIGFLISLIGIDSFSGVKRLTFGIEALDVGINNAVALIGIFAFSRVILSINNKNETKLELSNDYIKIKEALKYFKDSIYYSLIGVIIGAIPGAGSPVASFYAYSEAKRLKNPKAKIGEGSFEGLVASESANNGCIGGAFIPLVTLGLPGDSVTAVLISIFSIHSLKIGPLFLVENYNYFIAIVIAGLIACVFLFFLGYFIAPSIGNILKIDNRIIMLVVTILSFIGAYSIRNNYFDILIMVIFSFVSYFMIKNDFPVSPFVLSLVLGNMVDTNFRRFLSLMSVSNNILKDFFLRPITLVIIILIILFIYFRVKNLKKQK